jgi:hypothetical protein
VYDTIVDYEWRSEDYSATYLNLSRLGPDSIIALRPSVTRYYKDSSPTLPFYQKRTIYSNELLKRYDIFKGVIENSTKGVDPSSFLYSTDWLKPDGTKIVQAMKRLSQINIIDIQSDTITAYRMRHTPDFSLFEGTETDFTCYYYLVRADNQYIYALYYGDKLDALTPTRFDLIHVFDWDGHFVKKLKLGKSVRSIWLDPVNNLLYGYDGTLEGLLYCYDLNGINLIP